MGLIFINGKFYPLKKAKVSVLDRGFLYGDGVFETLRSYKGIIFKLDEHINRFFQSAKSIKLTIPQSKEEIKEKVLRTLRKSQIKDAYIRITLTRGEGKMGLDPDLSGRPTLVIIVKQFKPYPAKFYRDGIKIMTTSYKRLGVDMVNPSIKSANFMPGILAKIEAKQKSAFEVVFLNKSGFVTEGTVSNIFIVENSKLQIPSLITPPASAGILKGITRGVVIELARDVEVRFTCPPLHFSRQVRPHKEEKIKVEEKLFTLYHLYTAKECFLTNTSLEIMPVVNVDGRTIGEGKPGMVTNCLMREFKRIRGRRR